MAVYVDPIFHAVPRGTQARRCGTNWSHMWADTDEELHAMADAIGMRREWFQPKPGFHHYDLVPTKRTRAVKLGAVEMELIDWLREQRRKQEEPCESTSTSMIGGSDTTEEISTTTSASCQPSLFDSNGM